MDGVRTALNESHLAFTVSFAPGSTTKPELLCLDINLGMQTAPATVC